MSSAAASEIAANAAALRAELKEWERGFAAANGGRKAGRNDIKQVPEIGMSILPTAGFKNCEDSANDLKPQPQNTKNTRD
jgi:hypothetical protein